MYALPKRIERYEKQTKECQNIRGWVDAILGEATRGVEDGEHDTAKIICTGEKDRFMCQAIGRQETAKVSNGSFEERNRLGLQMSNDQQRSRKYKR